MSTIILTMTESDSQIISGIPEYVEFTTSEPATVFYTFDGTDPTDQSDMAVGKVYLPTLLPSFTLKAIALINTSSSVMLEQEYAVDQSDLDRSRRIDDEGITVLPAGEEPVDHLGVDVDGDDAQETVIEVVDLDIKASRTNRIGERLEDGTSKDFINFAEREIPIIIEEERSSPNDDNVDFNPNAQVIVINGYDQEDLESQVVRIINRPHGTMSVVSPHYNEHLQNEPIVTGNFVRSMYDPATRKIVFYYSESRENRWIKSIQKVEEPVNINLGSMAQPGFVFRWIEDRAMSKIF
nr:hypothetical protein 24 [bacterium]